MDMKVIVFTSEEGPETRAAKDMGASLEADGYSVAYYTTEDEQAHTLQELYDIYSYPSFVVTQDDGAFVERWQGSVPLESDIKMFLA
jgi:hypothetical protein